MRIYKRVTQMQLDRIMTLESLKPCLSGLHFAL